MNAITAIMERRSVRSYSKNPVPESVLKRIIEAGRLAPSACNIQPWCFVVVDDQFKRESIARTGRFARFLAESPVVIVGCGDSSASPKWHVVDVTIALENMVIAATAEGLGSCWIGSFDQEKVRALLKIPEDFRIVAMLALGYPADDLPKLLAPRKKTMEEITMRGEYGKPYA